VVPNPTHGMEYHINMGIHPHTNRLEVMASEQKRCPAQKRSLCSGVHPSALLSTKTGTQRQVGDVSTGFFDQWCRKNSERTFFHLHISHPGRLVSSRYVGRGLAQDVAAWSKTSLHCQQSKIHHHARTQLLHNPNPQRRFSHLNVDLVAPLQYSINCNYIFTIIDCASKWMETVPPFRYFCVGLSASISFSLDHPLWGTKYDHFQLQATMYFKSLG
jgi:hypothetical protein